MLARAILCSFSLALVVSCGPAQKDTATTEPEHIPPKPRQQKYQDKDGVSEKGKQWGGWRYQGKREDCFFKLERQCFATKAEACKAAGCSGKSCQGDSSAPVNVSCKQ